MKVLIMGSAPYIGDWWIQNSVRYEGWEVAALNNAWIVPYPRPITWWHSTDFFSCGHVIPGPIQREAMTEQVVGVHELRKPFTFEKANDGTVFLSVAYHYLNLSLEQGIPLAVHVSGSDFDYGPEVTHFYGEGTADPLRFGRQWLSDELRVLWERFGATCREIRSVGGKTGLLPEW